MMQLIGLAGTRKVRRCEFFGSASGAVNCLRRKVAATSAGNYGAINVWDDKDGSYRCEAMTHYVVRDSQVFTSLRAVRPWISTWLRKIHNGAPKGSS